MKFEDRSSVGPNIVRSSRLPAAPERPARPAALSAPSSGCNRSAWNGRRSSVDERFQLRLNFEVPLLPRNPLRAKGSLSAAGLGVPAQADRDPVQEGAARGSAAQAAHSCLGCPSPHSQPSPAVEQGSNQNPGLSGFGGLAQVTTQMTQTAPRGGHRRVDTPGIGLLSPRPCTRTSCRNQATFTRRRHREVPVEDATPPHDNRTCASLEPSRIGQPEVCAPFP